MILSERTDIRCLLNPPCMLQFVFFSPKAKFRRLGGTLASCGSILEVNFCLSVQIRKPLSFFFIDSLRANFKCHMF